MAYKNKFVPKNTSKYIGDPTKILCRSLWERKFCKYLDENKNILRWAFEKIEIPYKSPIDGLLHFYIPDFLLEKRNKDNTISTILVEIKPYKQTKQPVLTENTSSRSYAKNVKTYKINEAKWEAAREFCKKNEIKFVILTEKEIF